MTRSPSCSRTWKRSACRRRPSARGRTRLPPAEVSSLTQAATTPGPEVRGQRSNEMMLQGQLDYLALRVHPKFAQDSLEMVAYRDIADPQGLGNLPRRLALYQKAEDLFFPGR